LATVQAQKQRKETGRTHEEKQREEKQECEKRREWEKGENAKKDKNTKKDNVKKNRKKMRGSRLKGCKERGERARAMFYGAGGGRGSESFQAARGLCQIRRGSGISRAIFAGAGEIHDL